MQAVALRTQAALTAPRGRVRLVAVASSNQEPSTSGRQAPQAPRPQQQQTPRPGMMMGPNGRPLIMGPEGQPVEVRAWFYVWSDPMRSPLLSYVLSVRAQHIRPQLCAAAAPTAVVQSAPEHGKTSYAAAWSHQQDIFVRFTAHDMHCPST